MAKKAAAKHENIVRCQVVVKHKLTQEELHDKGREMIRKSREIALKKEQRKAVSSAAASEIKSLEAEYSDVQNQFDDGFESRSVEASVEFNPKKGIKSYYYHCPENKAIHKTHIRDESMVAGDYEQDLPGVNVKAGKQPVADPAAALQDELQRNQVAGDEEPTRVQSADAAE